MNAKSGNQPFFSGTRDSSGVREPAPRGSGRAVRRDGSDAWPQGRAQRFRLGLMGALPVVLGYLPIGFAVGVLAAQTGLSAAETAFMSLLVYAGASQFIALHLLGAGAAPLTIVMTTLLVNLRHLLMSAALSPYLRGVRASALAFLSFTLTDEVFAVNSVEFQRRGRGDPWFMSGLHLLPYLTWQGSTVVGAVLGGMISEPEAWGLDFALAAMFIGLLVLQWRSGTVALTVLMAAGLAVGFAPALPGWGVMLAAPVAAAVGLVFQRRTGSSSRAARDERSG